jgi:CRP-like cAMP-binding protein
MSAPSSPRDNQLLGALPAPDYRRLLPHLQVTRLAANESLFQPNQQIKFAFFPIDSIVKVSYGVGNGAAAEAWQVGREGMIGVSLLLNGHDEHSRAEVSCGGLAFRLSATVLLREFQRARALQRLLLRYLFALLIQASQLKVCHQHHSVEQRLCDFLSHTFIQAKDNAVFVTQKRIGMLLDVRRETITEISVRLQRAGIIRYFRGQVTLINRERLEKRACQCGSIIARAFGAVKSEASGRRALYRVAPTLTNSVPHDQNVAL